MGMKVCQLPDGKLLLMQLQNKGLGGVGGGEVGGLNVRPRSLPSFSKCAN